MSNLPKQYQRYAQQGPQEQPAPLVHAPDGQDVVLRDEDDPVVYIRHAWDPNESVPVRRSQLQPTIATAPRDLTPSQPLFDPGAQKILATGVGGGVLLWGGGQFLLGLSAAISAAAGAGAFVLAVALLLLVYKVPGGRRAGDTFITHNKNFLWGRSSTRN